MTRGAVMETPDSVAGEPDRVGDELRATLHELWLKVLQRRAPHVATWLAGQKSVIPQGDAAIPFLQALTAWFQMMRIVDENTAIRDRRQTESEYGPAAVQGSFAHTLATAGPNVDRFADLVKTLSVGPTLTAHPTEAKRVTILEIHRRIYRHLVSLETQRWTPRERSGILAQIEGEIDLLWMTGELRLERPGLLDEIEWGLQFFRDSIFDAVPQVFDQFENAAAEAFGTVAEVAPCIRFHSWIGGDRDGNPNVTVDMTSLALDRARKAAMDCYREALATAAAHLSISNHIRPLPHEAQAAVAAIIARGPKPDRNANELFRQAVTTIVWLLDNDGYANVKDFVADLSALEQALAAIDADGLAARYVRPIRWRALVFGFRTMTLDIRQNSTVTTEVLAELWGLQSGEVPVYGTPEYSTRLRQELSKPELAYLDPTRLSPQAQELLNLLRLIRVTRQGADPQAIGPFILSMTRSADDLLGVYLLARYAGFGAETLDITLVPLFETIEDLRAAPAILTELLAVPIARRSLKAGGAVMEIMLGYSDSNKDGGFVCSTWELDHAQRKIKRTLEKFGFRAAFFHGRGGSVSRGGAPTGRAIAAQPAGTISGQLRITEQGEVVSRKYANRGTAAAHLELLASSAMLHSLSPPAPSANPEFEDALEALSNLSQTAYRGLLQAPGFIDYFQQASPVEELAMLRIGSRPARRFGAARLDDLRAIPWVFAWSQNRHLITGWYGFGTAISRFRRFRGDRGDATLAEMFAESELFRLMVDEVEKSLFLTDMEIAGSYASLVRDEDTRQRIFGAIETEYRLACESVQYLVGRTGIADRFPNMRQKFERVRPDLDRINALQVELLRSSRDKQQGNTLSIPLLLSMNSISAGLGWTG